MATAFFGRNFDLECRIDEESAPCRQARPPLWVSAQ